jgi:hypothetical protein
MGSRAPSPFDQISTESVGKFVENYLRACRKPSESVKFIYLPKKWAETPTH